ncbi:hypothetical protein AT274_01520 [Bacillus cereus]|uniref:Uncharacterized protein n=2 Tax=Bacillus cereus group TaxID=86661 RepID=A0A150AZ86_BACCE|nr:hypothetical protein AT274_01520 [Bacillus cereus]
MLFRFFISSFPIVFFPSFNLYLSIFAFPFFMSYVFIFSCFFRNQIKIFWAAVPQYGTVQLKRVLTEVGELILERGDGYEYETKKE